MIPKISGTEKILIELYKARGSPCSLSMLSKKCKLTYVHTYEVVNTLEKGGVVTPKRLRGKKKCGTYVKLISLAEGSENIVKKLYEIHLLLKKSI